MRADGLGIIRVKLTPPLRTSLTLLAACWVAGIGGCSLFPEARNRDVIHNPFPQLKRVAILPFYNQSNEPTLNADLVTEKYYAALQAVPGFEVLPLGVSRAQWLQYAAQYGEPGTGFEFQELAKRMGVEAIVVGSVTDYGSFYPPRLAMTVHWYAANEGFHPIPAGYGLPWGTDQEKQIPQRIVREAEFELARSQLATQTPLSANQSFQPDPPAPANPTTAPTFDSPAFDSGGSPGHPEVLNLPAEALPTPGLGELTNQLRPVPGQIALKNPNDPFDDDAQHAGPQLRELAPTQWIEQEKQVISSTAEHFDGVIVDGVIVTDAIESPLPSRWPDPTDLIPDPPSPTPPVTQANREPVLAHTRLYLGDDPYFTRRLADYVETADDARSSGWQGYLRRSDDFIRFCCHLHVTEMLESRGGKEQSEFILRWPLSRY